MPVRSFARILLAAFSPIVAACASLTSRTTIDPGKAFRLGGGQAGAFTVRGTNSGPVPIVVFSELAGKRDSVATVAIKVTGDVGAFGMGYEQNPRP